MAVVERWPLGGWGGGRGREYNTFIVYCAKYMLTVFHNGNNPIITEIISRDKLQKMAELCFESKSVKVTKRKRFPTFAISVVDNLYLLQQYK